MTQASMISRPIEILLVDDNLDDIDLMKEALKDTKTLLRLKEVYDGEQALAYLRKQGAYTDAATPDLILLDLNMPKKDGREVLSEIKSDTSLNEIPVVVLTTSRSEDDVATAYKLHANCYISKPVDFNQFMEVVRSIESFWLSIVMLPATE